MNDHYEMQIGDLKDELRMVEEQLVKAESVIRFYSEEHNWCWTSQNSRTANKIIGTDLMKQEFSYDMGNYRIGGKRARSYFKEKGES